MCAADTRTDRDPRRLGSGSTVQDESLVGSRPCKLADDPVTGFSCQVGQLALKEGSTRRKDEGEGEGERRQGKTGALALRKCLDHGPSTPQRSLSPMGLREC